MSNARYARGNGERPDSPPPPPASPDGPPPAPAIAHAAVARAVADAPPACRIQRLTVRCSHNNRTASSRNRLQVVADGGGRNASYSRSYPPVQLTGTHSWGEEDTVTATVVSRAAGRKQTSKHPSAGPTSWDTGETRSYAIPAWTPDTHWPASHSPNSCFISGRGCDDERITVRVDSFPSQQFELAVNVALFSSIIEEVNREIGEALDGSFGPITIEPRLVGPTGTLSVKWGWKEHSDWRCCFAIEAQAGLSPAFGYDVEIRVSLSHIATTVGLSAAGVPPNLAETIADLGQEYLADAFVFGGIQLTFSIIGSGEIGFFPTGGTTGALRITPTVASELRIGMGARVGSEYWASVEVRGQATTGLSVSGAVEARADGLFFNPSIGWPGVTLSLTMSFRVGSTTVREDSVQWQPIQSATIWQPANPYKLAGG